MDKGTFFSFNFRELPLTINGIDLITFPFFVNLPLKIEWKALTFNMFDVIWR